LLLYNRLTLSGSARQQAIESRIAHSGIDREH
jgi:hypothetical protein